jgi:two-component SAPR family response regulator
MGAAHGMLGHLDKAIEEYTRALQIWTNLANDGEIALTLNGIGVARHRLGEYETALKLLQEAREKSEAVGDVRADAYALTSLGDLYRDLGQFDRALDCYVQGVQGAETIGEAYLQSYAASVRAEVLYLAGQTESAQEEIQHALSRGSLSRSAEARYRLALAIALLDRQESQQARAELDAALSLPGTESDIAFRGRIQLARVAMLEHQPQEARDQLHTAFQFAQEAGLTQPLSVESLQYIHVLQFAVKEGGGSSEIDRWIAAARELERTREQLSKAERVRTTGSRYPHLQIGAFGGSQVFMDDDAVSWRTNQAKELFFYLLTHPNGQTKEQIGAAIWPEHPSAKLFSIFRSSLFRVRKALFTEVVLFEENRYRLNDAISLRYDVQMFQQELSAGTLSDNPVQRAYHFRRAAELYRGEFLADIYADWVLPFREALQARCLQALTFLGEFNLDRGQYPVAIEFSRKILAIDEYHELAYYILIRAYARSGQRPQAKLIYDQCRSMLAEFGFSPQQSLEDLLR